MMFGAALVIYLMPQYDGGNDNILLNDAEIN